MDLGLLSAKMWDLDEDPLNWTAYLGHGVHDEQIACLRHGL